MRTHKRLSKAEGGNVMIEFAMLAPVFFMLIMGLVEFVLYQYKTYALNHIVYEATRNLQTGEVQDADDMREKFDEMCQESAGVLMNCNDIQWDVRSYDALNELEFPAALHRRKSIQRSTLRFHPRLRRQRLQIHL